MKAFIEANYKMIDINGDGVINKQEFCYNCITRIAVDNVQVVYDAFDSLLNVSYYTFWFGNDQLLLSIYYFKDDDRRRGGLTLSRYQELYAQYLGNLDEKQPGVYLFGPLNTD